MLCRSYRGFGRSPEWTRWMPTEVDAAYLAGQLHITLEYARSVLSTPLGLQCGSDSKGRKMFYRFAHIKHETHHERQAGHSP